MPTVVESIANRKEPAAYQSVCRFGVPGGDRKLSDPGENGQ